jgi:hypothetical protein
MESFLQILLLNIYDETAAELKTVVRICNSKILHLPRFQWGRSCTATNIINMEESVMPLYCYYMSSTWGCIIWLLEINTKSHGILLYVRLPSCASHSLCNSAEASEFCSSHKLLPPLYFLSVYNTKHRSSEWSSQPSSQPPLCRTCSDSVSSLQLHFCL